jgi:hypothetical protein
MQGVVLGQHHSLLHVPAIAWPGEGDGSIADELQVEG